MQVSSTKYLSRRESSGFVYSAIFAALLSGCGGGGGGESVEVVDTNSATAELEARRKVRTPGAAPAPAPTPVGESVQNTMIPSAAQIVDDRGATWTVANGIISRNGVPTESSSVSLLLYFDKVVYQQNAFGGWWKWDNTITDGTNPWVATTDPRASTSTPADPSQPSTSPTGASAAVGVSTAVFAQPAPSISITAHGASPAASATTNMAAINAAIAAAVAAGHKTVWVPPGTYSYNSIIHLNSGARLVGAGTTSVLHATTPSNRSIYLHGDGSQLKQLKITGNSTGARAASDPFTIATMVNVSNGLIENIQAEGADAAGIVCKGTGGGNNAIRHNTIRNTLADTIHNTDGCHHLLMEGNLIENAGDDGIAVVSYQSDGTRVNNITARNNIIRNNLWGRGMSVVGGSDVLYENNLVDGVKDWACLYISQENSWNTYSALNVITRNNTFKNCGSTVTGHTAIMVFSEGAMPNNNVTLTRNDIIQDGGRGGMRYFGPQTNIRFEQNKYTGTGQAYGPWGDVSGVTVIPYTTGSVGYVAP